MAIKVEDLRVGNLFLGYDDKVFPWSINEFGLLAEGIEIEVDEIIKEPIPLTKEWFLKLGGQAWQDEGKTVYSIDAFHAPMCVRFDIDFRDGVIYFKSHYNEQELNAQKMLKIQYVHQLQNLYHALTGQELTA